jgi:2-oxoisovalerate dehydrogenase E2 component (dihydrolipoyl transacylase)
MTRREFLLPDLGEGLREAVLVRWLVREGDAVELNQPLAEVETAKATIELPSPWRGTVRTRHWPEGSAVPVGRALVTFDAAEDVDWARSLSPRRPGPAPTSPAVRKLARERGVALDEVAGSGPDGRITRDDVEAAARGVTTPTAWTVHVDTRPDVIEVGSTRAATAERLERQASIPRVTTFRTVDATAVEALRRELGVSPLPIAARAVAAVIRAHPLLNSTWTGTSILVHGRINVGIATDTEGGLVVPVVKDVGDLGIAAIAGEIARLASLAREAKLRPLDLSGATITISNTGTYGSEHGTPLLNAGNAVTLAIGVVAPRALVVDGEVVARPAFTLSLTFDHRVLDGATVGRALSDLVDLLQDGDRLGELPQ